MSEANKPTNPNPDPNAEVTQLKTQIESLTNYVNEIGPFVQDASHLISVIAANPGLKDQVMTAVTGKQSTPPQNTPPTPPANQSQNPQWKFDPVTGQPIQQQTSTPPTPPTSPQPPRDPRVDSMDLKAREDVIGQIEAKFGYSGLSADKKKELRSQVEKKLNLWNTSALTAPVNQLPQLLEDAYLTVDLPKASEEGRLQGLIEARNNNMGMLPGMSSAPQKTETTTLSPDQQKWSKRWGLSEDKVTARLKEFQENNGVFTYKPKEEQPAQKQAPSGTPTPPAPAQ